MCFLQNHSIVKNVIISRSRYNADLGSKVSNVYHSSISYPIFLKLDKNNILCISNDQIKKFIGK